MKKKTVSIWIIVALLKNISSLKYSVSFLGLFSVQMSEGVME